MMAICNDQTFNPSRFFGLNLILIAVPNIILPVATIILDVIIVKYLQKIVPVNGDGHQDLEKVISIPIKATLGSAFICLLSILVLMISVLIDEPVAKSLGLGSSVFLINTVRAPLVLQMTYKLVQDRDEAEKQEVRLALQQREIDEARKNRQLRRQQQQSVLMETEI